MSLTVEHPHAWTAPRARARLTGVCYLAVFLTGFVYIALIPYVGLVGHNFDRGATHIIAHQSAFWVGYAAFLVSIALRLILMLLFYEMFAPVNQRLSQLAVYFNITATSVQAVVALLLLVPIVLSSGHHDAGAFTAAQLHALGSISLRLSYYAYTIGLVFFAAYDLLIGCLAFKSTFLPRLVGILMMITGFGWLTFIAPNAASHLLPFNLIAGVTGEVVMILWLTVKGVDEDRYFELVGSGEGGPLLDDRADATIAR
jgi:hypothetical protein